MIFTVGRTEAYEQYLNTDDQPEKLGKGLDRLENPYGGGGVCGSADEAQRYLNNNGHADYSVYGLIADLQSDSEQIPGEPYRRLLRNARIVRVAENAGGGQQNVA